MNSIVLAAFVRAASPDPGASSRGDTDPAAAEAAELFASAEGELAAGHWETALERLRRADELVPHPATKFHMARCLEELGRLREAWEIYGVVAEHPEVTPAERTAAAQRRAQVRSRLAAVRVQAREGGRVIVDAEDVCETPCVALADPGTHTVEVVWPDQAVKQDIELGESEVRELEIRPSAPPPVMRPSDLAGPGERPSTPRSAPPRWPTALTWVGAPLAALGGIGTIAFGSRTLALRRDHDREPTEDSQARGLRLRALTNASIAVGVAGGVLLVVDAIRYGVAKRRRRR